MPTTMFTASLTKVYDHCSESLFCPIHTWQMRARRMARCTPPRNPSVLALMARPGARCVNGEEKVSVDGEYTKSTSLNVKDTQST